MNILGLVARNSCNCRTGTCYFGPKRLPELGRNIGKPKRSSKRLDGFEREIKNA